MSKSRDYGQFCGLAAALNLMGERWTFLIVRELLIGPMRFNELLKNLPGVGPNLLAERLRMLAEHEVIRQCPVPNDKRGKLYELTTIGEELRAPLLSLARWGLLFLDDSDRSGVVRAEWGFLAVQAMIDEERIPDVDESYEFCVGDYIFTVNVRAGAAGFQRGAVPQPDLTITCDPDAFVRIGARMLTPFDAVTTGDVKIDGDRDAMLRCTRMLGLAP